MEPKTRVQLTQVEDLLWDSRRTVNRLEKRLRSHSKEIPPEFSQAREAAATCLASLRADPRCKLLHDLYDHAYGRESPRVPFRDCLRIGKIFVDVQIWQQYCFDAD